MARCRSCNAEIRWFNTASGKKIPINVGVSPFGNIRVCDGVAIVLSKLLLAEAYDRAEELYVSHYATCPNASEHRRTNPSGLTGAQELL